MGRTFLVSRHQGTLDWADRRGLAADVVPHVDIDQVAARDTVIGALPVHLIAAICDRGARYFALDMVVPPEWRGRNLTADEMEACGAKLNRYVVHRKADDVP